MSVSTFVGLVVSSVTVQISGQVASDSTSLLYRIGGFFLISFATLTTNIVANSFVSLNSSNFDF